MSGSEREANLRTSVGQAGLAALGLQDFAAQIIGHVSRGRALDDNALAAIRASCIRNLENTPSSGYGVQQEAEVFRKAIGLFERLADEAIRRGRRP